MKPKLATLWIALALGLATPAVAEAPATLAAAEAAYAEVDFEAAHARARAALERGGNDPRSTVRLYLLLGVSAAALDRADEARAAFTRVLAIDPSVKLEQSLSPKIRAPYLEARGAWATLAAGRALSAELSLRRGEWVVVLRDPLDVAARLAIEVRARPDGAFSRVELEAAAESRFKAGPRAEQERIEYVLNVLDEHGNALFRNGDRNSPATLQARPAALVVPSASVPAAAPGPNRTPYHLTAVLLSTLSAAAAATGVVYHLEREDLAREWNSNACESPGATRGEQCADVDRKRREAEAIAIGAYAGAAALLVSSAVVLAVAPSEARVPSGSKAVRLHASGRALELTYRHSF